MRKFLLLLFSIFTFFLFSCKTAPPFILDRTETVKDTTIYTRPDTLAFVAPLYEPSTAETRRVYVELLPDSVNRTVHAFVRVKPDTINLTKTVIQTTVTPPAVAPPARASPSFLDYAGLVGLAALVGLIFAFIYSKT